MCVDYFMFWLWSIDVCLGCFGLVFVGWDAGGAADLGLLAVDVIWFCVFARFCGVKYRGFWAFLGWCGSFWGLCCYSILVMRCLGWWNLWGLSRLLRICCCLWISG